ncbi:MAG: dihydroorotase family protein [Paracoccaceae bacterium]|jgi:dihydroorotase-like cyclic amidohydrolase|nr:dihydroorotase family protein [Paracoccaceae bacterium]
MGQADLGLRGGTVHLPDGALVEADVLVAGGRIAGIVAPGTGEAAESVDVGGLTVLPGAVDAHLHLGHGMSIARPRVPDDAKTETGAAATGGVTCFIPYVMGADPYLPVFDEIIGITEAGARIDFSWHFVIATDAQMAELPTLIAHGAPTAKLFMNIRGDEGARLGLPGIDDGFMFRLLETLAATGGMLCPHPENIEVAWVLRDRVRAADPEGEGGLATWNATRPPHVEADALARACRAARITGAPLHAVHTSSAEALRAALAERAQGSDVSIETCLHYLTHDETSEIGAVGKVNPPLRAPEDREALWTALAAGQIDTVGTDHIHRPIASKEGGIWKAQPGFPGLDAFLPVYLTEGHHRRGLPLSRLIPLVTSNPARRMGLSRKGALRVGMDADIAVVDLHADWTITRDSLATDAGFSIWEGQRMGVRVVHTLSRGRFALRDGALTDESVGRGRFVARHLEGAPLSHATP